MWARALRRVRRRSGLRAVPDPETRVIGGYLAGVAASVSWLLGWLAVGRIVAYGAPSPAGIVAAGLALAFMTGLFAFPGFAASFAVAFILRIGHPLYFILSGLLVAVGLSALVARPGSSEISTALLAYGPTASAGAIGGATFWSVAGRFLGPLPDAREPGA